MGQTIISCAVTGSAPTPGKICCTGNTVKIVKSALNLSKPGRYRTAMCVTRNYSTKHECGILQVMRVLNLAGPGARFTPSANDPSKASNDSRMSTPSDRIKHVLALRPEIYPFDIVTMNRKHHVFESPDHLKYICKIQAGKTELKVFDTGHMLNANKLIEDGLIQSPPFFQFCLGLIMVHRHSGSIAMKSMAQKCDLVGF